MSRIRKQLTLFLNDNFKSEIEEVRKKYNPVQFHLIKAHVTLCRENELENLAQIKQNLSSINLDSIRINFDQIVRFSDQNGVMLSAKKYNDQFHHLRKKILRGCNVADNFPDPHITLMHPRNSTCTDEIFNEIRKINIPESMIFKEIVLIQQKDHNEWKILETFQI